MRPADIDALISPQHEALVAARQDADAADRRVVTKAIVAMLEEDRRAAYVRGQPAVAVSASCAIAKILNLFERQAGVGGQVVVHITAADAAIC